MKKMWTIRQGFFALVVQPIIWRIFESRVLELLKDSTNWGGFKVTLEWTWFFYKDDLIGFIR